ncbi:hypothetical protein EAH87_07770 [Sphingomonas koreensis]|nr:hypothetical protein EAH87_07770 [Sphingomonas koreensis]
MAIGGFAFGSIAWWIPLFIYRPAWLADADPGRWAVAASKATIASEDDRLVGWWCPAVRPGGTVVLILHGRSANITTRTGVMRALIAAGDGVLTIDYRGYGASTGHPSEAGLNADALAAYDWLHRIGVARQQIIVLGQSLGDTAADRFPWLPIGRLYWPCNRFDVVGNIGGVAAPVLLIASADDGLVPLSASQRLAGRIDRPRWLRSDRFHHDGLLAGVAATGGLATALERLARAPSDQ